MRFSLSVLTTPPPHNDNNTKLLSLRLFFVMTLDGRSAQTKFLFGNHKPQQLMALTVPKAAFLFGGRTMLYILYDDSLPCFFAGFIGLDINRQKDNINSAQFYTQVKM